MKIGRRRAPLLLFLFSALISCEAIASDNVYSAKSLQPRGPVSESSDPVTGQKSGPVGTEHAPVDGKDGMPHEGPFVETEAERSRKKAKESGEEEDVEPPTKKPLKPSKGTPQSNDGVMDDPSRRGPADGTRGVEGGVTEKSKDGTVTKKPEQPKEAPPLPHSEKEKIQGPDGEAPVQEENKKPLAVPTDLPAKPHDIPHPQNPTSPKDSTIDHTKPLKNTVPSDHEPAVISPMHSLFLSFTMILFSEIGDKTFLVACLMAMRHDRILVFSAAYAALITMTVLSAILGHAVPTLIPRTLTNFAAAGLFLVFGVKMFFEARKISPDEGVSEEMKEVEMELEEKEHQAQRRMSRRRSSISPYVLESGRAGGRKHNKSSATTTSTGGRLPSPPESPISESSSRDASPSRGSTISNAVQGMNNLFSLLLSPAWVQTFVMTFLGEWGDRSQIATIAMAAGQDYWWVTAGALGGHAICTGVAVIGGKAIAGKVSLRTVTMGGAIAFLIFGVIYLLEAVY